MSTSATLHCPGKINLLLEVLNKRPDGYHNIKTIFQDIQVGDTLSAQYSTSMTTITLDGGTGITENTEQNLIIRAAKALQAKCQTSKGIHFTLKKTLPMGAGLGGGSSNCAAALKLCNQLWELNLPVSELILVGQNLGADVPFFIEGGTALGEGIGEKLTTLPSPPPFHVLIATPNAFVSTKEAYEGLNADRSSPFPNFVNEYINLSKNSAHSDPLAIHKFFSQCYNDFHQGTLENFPEIRAISQKIQEFNPTTVLLSGSGASLFALFQDKSVGNQCLASIQSQCRFSILTSWVEHSTTP